MLVVLIELNVVGKLAHFSIDAHASESFSRKATDQLAVRALFASHQRRQQLVAGAFGKGQDLIHHLIDGLGPDRPITLRTVRFSSPAEEKSQVILNLGDGPHGGPGIVARGFLIDRDGR